MHMKRSLKVIVSIGTALFSTLALSGCGNCHCLDVAQATISCARDDMSVEIMVLDKEGTPKEYIPKQDPAVVVKEIPHKTGESNLVYTAPDKSALPEHDGYYRLRVTCKGKRSNWVGSKSGDSAGTQRDFVSIQTDKADSFLFDKSSSALRAKQEVGGQGTNYIRCYSQEDSREVLKDHTAEANIVCEAI